MPGPFVVPVFGDLDLPKAVDVVVIGGGIIGAATALELAEAGKSVAICEKGGIGHEQSSRNWGWVRLACRDPREIELMMQAQRLWHGLEARVGRNVGYQRSGISFMAEDEKTYTDYQNWLHHIKGAGVDCSLGKADAFSKHFADCTLRPYGALTCKDDGRAEPQKATSAIVERARELGVHVLTECAVRGVETSTGQISGVVTERGRIACEAVVLAGGAWSEMFLTSLNRGIHLPQLKVKNSVLRTKPMEGGPDLALWAGKFAIRKREDGGYTIASGHGNVADIVPASFRYFRDFIPALKSEWRALHLKLGWRFWDEARQAKSWALDEASPFEYARVLDPKPTKAFLDDALSLTVKAFPKLQGLEVAQTWAGYIDAMPDALPVIDQVEQVPGLFVSTGYSGHGFGISLGAGKLTADFVLGRSASVNPDAYRLKRFVDGSKIKLQAGY